MQRLYFALAVGFFALLTACGTDKSLTPLSGMLTAEVRGGPDPTTSFFAGANSASAIGMGWMDNSPNESGWEIHRSTNGAAGSFTLRATLTANSTSYGDEGLAPLTEYCYTVRSFKQAGSKTMYAAFFNTACATTYGPPPAASALDAIPRDYGQVDVAWTDNSQTETGFRLERAGAVAGPWTSLPLLGANTVAFHDTGRPTEELLCYRVIAVNQWGDGSPSNVDCSALPAAPTQVAAASSDNKTIDVTWQDNSAFEDGFEVQRARSGENFVVIANLAANVASFHDTDVLPEIQYLYFVRAKKEGAFSGYTTIASAVISTGPPLAPNVDAVPYGSTATYVYWWPSSVTTQRGRIERKIGGIWSVVSGPAADPSFLDAGLAAEQEVCYRAIAYNGFGESQPSAEDCTTPPAAPTNVTVSIVDEYTNQVNWTDNSNVEDAYELTFYWIYCYDGWYCEDGYYTIWTEPNATSYQYYNSDTFIGIAAVNDGGYSDPGTGPAVASVSGAGIRAAPKLGSRPAAIAPTGRPAKLKGASRPAAKQSGRIPR